MIDSKLIKHFRTKVGDSNFVCEKYKNIDGKNKWNRICSAMDWIEVSADYLTKSNVFSKDDNIMSIQVFTYISCIDIILEAIKQLHQVFYNTTTYPYKGEKSVFPENNIKMDDTLYFKTIRACFGAHPVDLNDDFAQTGQHERWYASWSGFHFSENGDFSVVLSSDQVNIKDIFFDIKFSELNKFLEIRYSYLNQLINEIDRQYLEFCDNLKVQEITTSNNPVEQLKILSVESKKRLNNNYYDCLISQFQVLFSAIITCQENIEKVNCYRNTLFPIIRELKDDLQNMVFGELITSSLFEIPVDIQSIIQYPYSTISDHVLSDSQKPIFCLNRITDLLDNYVVFQYENTEELYLLIHTGCYYYTLENSPTKRGEPHCS